MSWTDPKVFSNETQASQTASGQSKFFIDTSLNTFRASSYMFCLLSSIESVESMVRQKEKGAHEDVSVCCPGEIARLVVFGSVLPKSDGVVRQVSKFYALENK